MPRAKHIDPPTRFETTVPLSLLMKVKLELHSEIEQGVPFGAMQKLVVQLFTEWLRSRGVES